MLRTRLITGAVLVALAIGVLVIDQWLAPWYPFLLLLVLGLALAGCYEVLQLLTPPRRPNARLCYIGVTALVLVNWLPQLARHLELSMNPWPWIGSVFIGIVLAAFVVEMVLFQQPGDSVIRIALTVWLAAYLGLLPSFFAQLRWLDHGTLALALAIFVPKCGDAGAYFVGRFLGRHPMTPLLSPKKTWEGLAGGLVASVVAALVISQLGPVLSNLWWAALFGLVVGVAAVLGDLAESLIKRNSGKKDASSVLPGMGGVLDLVDSILFAAPVVYWWLIV